MHFSSTFNKLFKYRISVDFLLMEVYVQGALRNKLHIAPFIEHFKKATLGRSYRWILPVLGTIYLNIAFFSIFLLIEGYVQGALRKELHICPFVERFKIATLGRSCWWLLPVLGIIYSKNWISSEFLLMEGYVQGALWKDLHIVPFVERFKRTTLGKSM